MKLVSNQLSPNLLFKDALYGLLFLPWLQSKKEVNNEHIFSSKNQVLLNSARSGLGLITDIVKPNPKKKIGIPAFTCGVVATPFLERNYEIEWIDTNENGLINPVDFKTKASNISMIVVPHIFGQEADVPEIKTIAEEHDIFVVKDSAHRLDTDLSNCDALILSFGREKVISCVSGGALLWNTKNKHFQNYQQNISNLSFPSVTWTIKHLLHPLWFALALPIWTIGKIPIGKALIHLTRKLHILPLAVSAKEKKGIEDMPIHKLPYPQQKLIAKQYKQLDRQSLHQAVMAKKWEKELSKHFPENKIIIPDTNFRVIMICKDQTEKQLLQTTGAQHNMLLHDWEGVPISPHGTDLHAFGYIPGQCPVAEHYAQHQLTFPTNKRTHLKDIERFCKLIKS